MKYLYALILTNFILISTANFFYGVSATTETTA